MDPATYCREVEAYLCQKNDGHLIRIVGPAFEQVCGWAVRGVPLNIVFRGIDQRFDRYYAKGPRRRPLRIEFCEADVLELFDQWRRTVGVAAWSPVPDGVSDASTSVRRPALSAHLDRVISRLTVCRASPSVPTLVQEAVARVVDELDARRAEGARARGEARGRVLTRLRELDDELLAVARRAAAGEMARAIDEEARAELAPFSERMAEAAFERALESCRARLLRDRFQLPEIALE